jgi:hypothetical protein
MEAVEAPKTIDEAISMMKASIRYCVVNKVPFNYAVTLFKEGYAATAVEVFKTKSQAAVEISFHRNSLLRNMPSALKKKMPQRARLKVLRYNKINHK